MSEQKKIEMIIEKYEEYIEDSNIDIAVSTYKKKNFIYSYDVKHNMYELFCEFNTAKELEKIIKGLIAEEFNLSLEYLSNDFNSLMTSSNINAAMLDFDYEKNLAELAVNIKNLADVIEKNEKYFKALKYVLK